jgi:4-hydroxythreonine-4-phosphate dehydrogenase
MEWIIRQVWVKSELPDGTAYDIAGKGIADHNFKEAVYLALDIYRSRIEYAEISQKPLRVRDKQH